MALQKVDLPSPEELRGRWAALSAVMAAIGWGTMSNSDATRWHYDDAGGNWVELARLADGRAVMYGHDHEYSQTYFREAAEYFGEDETDLLADAPAWWELPLPVGNDLWIGFVYGFDGSSWHRASYDLDDGFKSVGLPALSIDLLCEFVVEMVRGVASRHGVSHEPTLEALQTLATSGANARAEELGAVLGPLPCDINAGVAAARAFAPQ